MNNLGSLSNSIVFRKFSKNDSAPFTSLGFNLIDVVSKKPIYERIFETIGFEPCKRGLVAYHVQAKRAVGFLSLVEHTSWLYSIKFVFVDPRFRRMGIGTGLLDFALSQARKRGAKKIFLNVSPKQDFVINFYTKLGFRPIMRNLEVWAHTYVSDLPIQTKINLVPLNLNQKENRTLLFDISYHNMGKEWIDFFELNINNLTNGFSQDFRRLFYRFAFLNDTQDSSAMIFTRPLIGKYLTFLETFIDSDTYVPSMLENLTGILQRKGVVYARIKLFNVKNNATVDLIKQKEQYLYDSVCMGLIL